MSGMYHFRFPIDWERLTDLNIVDWVEDFQPRSFGPKCPIHGERHMKRVATMEYACLKSGQIFQLRELFPNGQELAHGLE